MPGELLSAICLPEHSQSVRSITLLQVHAVWAATPSVIHPQAKRKLQATRIEATLIRERQIKQRDSTVLCPEKHCSTTKITHSSLPVQGMAPTRGLHQLGPFSVLFLVVPWFLVVSFGLFLVAVTRLCLHLHPPQASATALSAVVHDAAPFRFVWMGVVRCVCKFCIRCARRHLLLPCWLWR